MHLKIKCFATLCGVISFSVFLLSSCVKEDMETIVLPIPNGKIPVSVIPQDIQDSLVHHGMTLFEGTNPPNVMGHYLIAPMQLEYASDSYSNLFMNTHVWFLRQNRRGLITYTESQTAAVSSKPVYGGVIGHDSCFSVYCYATLSNDSSGVLLWQCKTATVVSGIKTEAGIRDCKYAFVMLEKDAIDEQHYNSLSPIGTYRIFYDGDSLSAEIQ